MWLLTTDASALGSEEVASRLQVDTRVGLWWDEVNHRKQLFGDNEFSFKKEETLWKKYIEQVIFLICISFQPILTYRILFFSIAVQKSINFTVVGFCIC